MPDWRAHPFPLTLLPYMGRDEREVKGQRRKRHWIFIPDQRALGSGDPRLWTLDLDRFFPCGCLLSIVSSHQDVRWGLDTGLFCQEGHLIINLVTQFIRWERVSSVVLWCRTNASLIRSISSWARALITRERVMSWHHLGCNCSHMLILQRSPWYLDLKDGQSQEEWGAKLSKRCRERDIESEGEGSNSLIHTSPPPRYWGGMERHRILKIMILGLRSRDRDKTGLGYAETLQKLKRYLMESGGHLLLTYSMAFLGPSR